MPATDVLRIVVRLAVALIAVAAIAALCLWLNVSRSVPLMLQGAALQRQPAHFDIEFVGLDPGVAHVAVELFYFPVTPVFGLTSHYTNIIAPNRIDSIDRTFDVPVRSRHVRFSAPLGLFGIDNYRLRSAVVGDEESAYRLQMAAPEDPSHAPKDVDIPAIAVRDGDYRFDGALALFRLTASGDANPYAYAVNVTGVEAPILWEGLRTLRARVDLAPYALTSFDAHSWAGGAGWKQLGYQLTHAHATLTDTTLTIARDVTVPVPFARECQAPPQFTLVSHEHVPRWSRIDGLWRPVARGDWDAFRRGSGAPAEVSVHFSPAASGRPSLEREEFLEIDCRTAGNYRLFAACPNPHYDSVAVTWLDVVVNASPRGP
jgi:hypothetical protein